MKRKDYQKPTMKVVELQHKCQILAGSGEMGSATLNATYEEETWDE